AVFVGYTSAMVTGVWLGNDDNKGTRLSGGNVPATIWSQFMTKAHAGRSPQPIPGGSYAGQLIAQQVIDPNTGMPVIDPNTGQPVQTLTAPTAGQVYAIGPATGQPMQGLQPIQGQSANPPIQTGTMTDPATGMQYDATTGQPLTNGADPTWGQFDQNVQYDSFGQAIDPVTGNALQQPNNGAGNAPVDPDTGLPMTLIVDPATGEQVWVPSAPASQNQPVYNQQPIYAEPQVIQQQPGQFAP